MAYRPKTVRGNIFAALVVIAAVPAVLWAAVTLSGPIVWISLIVIALASIAVYLWLRRDNAARQRAWVGAYSFADVTKRMRAREALQLPARSGHRVPSNA
jgi:uncharacterized membrane protein YhhN